jgi:hypothetical protein
MVNAFVELEPIDTKLLKLEYPIEDSSILKLP